MSEAKDPQGQTTTAIASMCGSTTAVRKADSYRYKTASSGSVTCISLITVFLVVVFFLAQPMDFFYVTLTQAHRSLDTYLLVIRHGFFWRELALIIILLWSLAVLLIDARGIRVNGAHGWGILLFLFLAAASVAWADDPSLCTKRVAVLFILSFGALALARRLTLADITTVVLWACGIVLCLGLAAEIVQGVFSPFDGAYRFAGTMHPNSQGTYCGFLSIAAISLAASARRHRFLFVLAAIIGFSFLILTKSRTALTACLASIGLYSAIMSRRPVYRSFLMAWTSLSIALMFLLLHEQLPAGPQNLLLMGRGEAGGDMITLNGRISLWARLLPFLYDRPFLGYGYGSFWIPRRLSTITESQGWVFGSAHSGYLEMSLSLGLLGASLYVIILLSTLARLIAAYRKAHIPGLAFGAAIIAFNMIAMILSTVPLSPDLPMFVCMATLARTGFISDWT